MKTVLFALCAACATSLVQAQTPPKIHFGVLEPADNGRQYIQEFDGNLYASKPQSLCWGVEGLPTDTALNAQETFQTPAPARFERPNALISSSQNGRIYHIYSSQQANNGGLYISCWKLGHEDPAGEYGLSVQIGGFQFPTYTFRLNK